VQFGGVDRTLGAGMPVALVDFVGDRLAFLGAVALIAYRRRPLKALNPPLVRLAASSWSP
jgi:hypothetical protein